MHRTSTEQLEALTLTRSRLPTASRPQAGDAMTTFVLPPPGINKNIIPSPRSQLLYWPTRQIFHNVGSSNWASCQSQAPQVVSVLQSGRAARVGLEGSLCTWEPGLYSGAWRQSGSRRFLRAEKRGHGNLSASWRQPSTEGVKTSQHVWLLMIATHQGPGEY